MILPVTHLEVCNATPVHYTDKGGKGVSPPKGTMARAPCPMGGGWLLASRKKCVVDCCRMFLASSCCCHENESRI